MKNSNVLMLAKSSERTLGIVLIVVSLLLFFTVLFCVWWTEVKKRKLKDIFVELKNGIWFMCEQIYAALNPSSSVKTVYSDKARNYSGTEFLPIPTKAPTSQYTYEFVGWDKNGVDEKGNIVVRAIYLQKVAKCYINFYDDDKVRLVASRETEYGAGVNVDDLKLSKPETKEFIYEFVGWDKDTTAFFKNENVYAVYNAIPKKYEYKFFDDDGETILSQGIAIYGTPIMPPKEPTKLGDETQIYEFVGWKNYSDGMVLTKDINFTAVYAAKPVEGVEAALVVEPDGTSVSAPVEEVNVPEEVKPIKQAAKRKTVKKVPETTENKVVVLEAKDEPPAEEEILKNLVVNKVKIVKTKTDKK